MTDKTHPLWQHIRTVPNFPKEGIDFYDITPLLNGQIDALADALLKAVPADVYQNADYLCAIESRGFILASILAAKTGKSMLLVRKKGKLPPPVHSYTYTLEYGTDTLEIGDTVPAGNVLIVDDVLATGGTLKATNELCKQAGHSVLGALILLDLVDLHGDLNSEIGLPVFKVFNG